MAHFVTVIKHLNLGSLFGSYNRVCCRKTLSICFSSQACIKSLHPSGFVAPLLIDHISAFYFSEEHVLQYSRLVAVHIQGSGLRRDMKNHQYPNQAKETLSKSSSDACRWFLRELKENTSSLTFSYRTDLE